MKLHLVDINSGLVAELRSAFRSAPEVDCVSGDILEVAQHALVSPANSYGFMDGGIDAAYAAFFGKRIQSIVQEAVNRRPEGYLPVGASLAVRTGHSRIPYLIVAPTMQLPERVSPLNCYRAMRAILRLVDREPVLSQDVFCPGLATGIGGVPFDAAAQEMFQAYADWINQRSR